MPWIRDSETGDESCQDDQSCKQGVEHPATPRGIACEAPSHHYTGERQRHEGEQARERVNRPVRRWKIGRRYACRMIVQVRVGDKNAREDQSQPENTKTQGATNSSLAWTHHLPQSQRKAEGEDAAHEEIRNLHPSLVAQT